MTDLSTNFVVMQIHQSAHVERSAAPLSITLRSVHEALGEPQTVSDVVAAPAPLPAVRGARVRPVGARVARALGQVAGATCLRHGVRDPRTGGRVHERRLLRTWQTPSEQIKHERSTVRGLYDVMW